jgi:NADH-quinone oxidoreductase chain G
VADGMVVRTNGEKIQSQRAGTLEFILLNHPLDCPVCDKGGECELQDRTFEYSTGLSRMTEPKVHVEDYDLGPLIVRNQDRCIICKRCIKVMEEIVGDPVLEFGQRGVTTEINTIEHEEFKAGFSGNTIRVCPVGALMSKPFRFKARPWELIKTPSVCGMCSVGCNVRADVRENKLLRVVGLENPQVNDGWLCDRGQFGYDYVESPNRVKSPMIRRANGQLEQASWEEAISTVVERLKTVDRESFGAIAGDRSSNEDLYALRKFTRETIGSSNLDHRNGSNRTDFSTFRPSPGAIVDLPKSDVVLIVGSDLTAEAPVLDLILKRTLLPKKMKLIVANPRATALDKFATQVICYLPGEEVALLSALGGRSSAGHGVSDGEISAAAQLISGAQAVSILFGQDIADGPNGDAVLAGLKRLAGANSNVCLEVVRGANIWGARNLGILPDGKGLGTGEMLQGAADGKITALFIMGANPLAEYPDAAKAKKAIDNVPFLIVADLFLTETAAQADVVFPAVAFAERNCTLTNVEGRVQRTVRALDPAGASKQEWAVLGMIAEDLGKPLELGSADTLARTIRTELADVKLASPAGAGAPTGAAPAPDSSYPFRLFTGWLMFDRSTMQGQSRVIPGLAPDPFVEINPADAARLLIQNGDHVTVATAKGKLDLRAHVTEGVAAGSAFVPSGYNEAPVNTLWSEGAAVVNGRISRLEQ